MNPNTLSTPTHKNDINSRKTLKSRLSNVYVCIRNIFIIVFNT